MPGIPWLSRSSVAPKGLPSMRVYRRYRAAGTKLNHKIIEATLDDSAIHYAVSALGMMGPGKTIILDSEDESSVLMDFALYEYNLQGKNAIEEYAEEIGGETEIERELLAAMVTASTSLFRVESVSKKTHSLSLRDLVNEDRTLALMDINFSQQPIANCVLFLRPITLETFSMTSGIAFAFPESLEKEVLRRWYRPPRPRGSRRRRRRTLPAAAMRYVTFFKLSKRKGIPTMYKDVSGEE